MQKARLASATVLLVVCLLHILGVMSFLVREGRLSIVPIYDDVSYLIDAIVRLRVLDLQGLGGFFVDLLRHPSHAPFMAIAGTFGLAMSAGDLWGPYLLNGAWVIVSMALGAAATAPANRWIRVGVLMAVLAAPMFRFVLAEFRPDPVWGLLIGFALAWIVNRDVAALGRKRLLMLGALLGCCVLAKPTAAPATIVVLSAGLVVKLALARSLRGPGTARRQALRALAWLSVGAVCVIAPYALTNGPAILSYVVEVTGTQSVWRTRTSLWGHLSYYLRHDTGTLMLGWIWYAYLPAPLLTAVLLLRQRDRAGLSTLAALCAAAGVAYLIVSISGVKSLMIGSILYGTLIALTAWCMARIATHVRLRSRFVVLLGLLALLFLWAPQTGMVRRDDPAMRFTDAANRAALPVVLDALQQSPRRTALVSVPGPTYAGTLDFLCRERGMTASFRAAYTWDKWSDFVAGVEAADVVILSEAGMTGQALGFAFPSPAFQAQLLDFLRGSRQFQGRPVLTDEAGRSVWVFSRVR